MKLYNDDCIDVLKTFDDNSIDSIVTDPPYGLAFMGKSWDNFSDSKNIALGKQSPANKNNNNSAFRTRGKPIAGWSQADKEASKNFQIWTEEWAIECLRVLKPGGHLLAFSGTRTYHRMACAIEDAGFEIRDQLGWMYGSGFPKSHDVSKAIDKALGDSGSATDGARGKGTKAVNAYGDGLNVNFAPRPQYQPESPEAAEWQGWGTALKPAWEPICLARKPLIGTVAKNVQEHGTGAINIDGCRVPSNDENPSIARRKGSTNFLATEKAAVTEARGEFGMRASAERFSTPRDGELLGRWPANVIHDGSDEVLVVFPESNSARASGNPNNPRHGSKNRQATSYDWNPESESHDYRDTGSAARFFYCAKVSKKERGEGNNHPTVKPIALMQYLCRLVTPPNGIVLDPFMGSGSTGIAALNEGFSFIGIEKEQEYFKIADNRIKKHKNNSLKGLFK